MPITLKHPVRILSQQEYHELNHRALGVIFDVHNEYGRLLDESVFKGAITARWNAFGKAEREVPIHFTHGSFSKTLFMDLLFDDGLMVEAKVVDRLAGIHRAQTLNYLFATGMRHGTLVNLRPVRVEREFVSTNVTSEQRRDVLIQCNDWRRDEVSTRLADCAEALFRDFGGYLEIALYREAIVHLLSLGEPTLVDILDDTEVVGKQPLLLLSADTALACTALHGGTDEMSAQLHRLLAHTRLAAIHWLNFNRATLALTTIKAR